MTDRLSRRAVLATAAGTALAFPTASARAVGAGDRIVVGVMGMGGRGTGLARVFAQQPNVTVAYVCDPDQRRVEQAAAAVAQVAGQTPKAVADFRRILDDRDVDALVVATCNHWHGPATIWACAAGKHVYVEKPCSHNPREGELMIAAARKYDRRVQMGNQRRSYPKIIEAMQRLRGGVIGNVYYAQSYYTNNRPSIGRGRAISPPEHLDYELWQGPAPRRPFRDNILHYNWHWFWHWGNGELGNNGVHYVDLCRWGLGVDYPVQAVSTGGRYRYQDDQETPDTHMATWTFPGGKMIMWEGLSCNRMPEGSRAGDVIFHGEKGSLAIRGSGYTIHDPEGRVIERVTGTGGDALHIANFLAAIRSDEPLTSEIEEGHKSTLLCHLGNISYRVGRIVTCDPKTGRIVGDREAALHWRREYARGWEPTV